MAFVAIKRGLRDTERVVIWRARSIGKSGLQPKNIDNNLGIRGLNMADLFSDAWMKGFMEQWNSDPELTGALEQIGFGSIIGYGFEGEDQPRGVISVENGKAVSAGGYNGEALNWDIRCAEAHWNKWISKPPGMMGLGMAFTSGKMKFKVGDYGAMLKDPRMAAPFIKTFSVMGRVG